MQNAKRTRGNLSDFAFQEGMEDKGAEILGTI